MLAMPIQCLCLLKLQRCRQRPVLPYLFDGPEPDYNSVLANKRFGEFWIVGKGQTAGKLRFEYRRRRLTRGLGAWTPDRGRAEP